MSKNFQNKDEFPKIIPFFDVYGGIVRFKWNLKDDLFLNPARLFPR